MIIIFTFIIILFADIANGQADSIPSYSTDIIEVNGLNLLEKEEVEAVKILNSTEDLLEKSNRITLIRRANFGLEPVLRSVSSEKLNITIDGMHIFGACVDKMDPASSYIELENIKNIDIGNTRNIDFRTSRLRFNKGINGTYSSFYGSNSNLFNNKLSLSYSNDLFSSQINVVVKRSGDYLGGGDSLIKNSSFEKENYVLKNSLKIDDNNSLNLNYIADFSRDVGYPALIMDTRETRSHFIYLEHDYHTTDKQYISNKAKVYYTNIYHLMDDYSRSIEEINNRIIMPSMYMPMVGINSTMGFVNNTKIIDNNSMLNIIFDFYYLNMIADMDMIPIEEGAVMHLFNLANINSYNTKLGIKYSCNYRKFEFENMFDVSYKYDYLSALDGKKALEAYVGEFYDIDFVPFTLFSGTKYKIKWGSFGIDLKYEQRAPNRYELFSYFIYNPVDNSINMGNPELEKEELLALDFKLSIQNEKFISLINIFYDFYTNYISTISMIDSDEESTIFSQSTKQYRNTGKAFITGLEFSSVYNYNKNFNLSLSAKYNYAYSIQLGDYLPFISPFKSNLNIKYRLEDVFFAATWVYSAPQNNISQLFFNENKTDAYHSIDLICSYDYSKNVKIKTGIDNLFDIYIIEHTSIGDLPSLGRNFYIEFTFKK